MKLFHTDLWIDEKYLALYQKNGFDSFRKLYNCDRGRLVRGELDKSIKYFELEDNSDKISFYLKKQHTTLLANLKRLLRRLSILKLSTRHELELVRFYQSYHIPVVHIVAWGEERWFGLPIRGFIIQEEVKGIDFVDVVKRETRKKRLKLIKAYGQFVGQLHQKGVVSSIVRVTDIICNSTEKGDWKSYKYVVIDREKGPLTQEKVEMDLVCRVLANILVRFVLYIDSPSLREIIGFLKAYSSTMYPSHPMEWKEIFYRSEKYFVPLMDTFDEKI